MKFITSIALYERIVELLIGFKPSGKRRKRLDRLKSEFSSVGRASDCRGNAYIRGSLVRFRELG